jgi:carbon-monoxide dehydrogenase small subunit
MSTHEITLTVNNSEEELTVESRTLLVHALRDELGYTGPKVGCETSKCGACTVSLDGDAVKSCTVLAVQADGADVTTVEGLADEDALHPIQESFHEEHGLQCGYCTPGMVMTTRQLLEDDPDPSPDEIRHRLKGNVCRCTGYQNVVNAVERSAQRASGDAGDAVEEAADQTSGEETRDEIESPAKPDGGPR